MSLKHGVTAALLVFMMYLQVKNFIKFHLKNGANQMRVLIFMSSACMFVHSIRLMLGMSDGSFLLVSVAIYLAIYFKEPNT